MQPQAILYAVLTLALIWKIIKVLVILSKSQESFSHYQGSKWHPDPCLSCTKDVTARVKLLLKVCSRKNIKARNVSILNWEHWECKFLISRIPIKTHEGNFKINTIKQTNEWKSSRPRIHHNSVSFYNFLIPFWEFSQVWCLFDALSSYYYQGSKWHPWSMIIVHKRCNSKEQSAIEGVLKEKNIKALNVSILNSNTGNASQELLISRRPIY